MQTTFTVLVTLGHDKAQGHSPSRISEIVQTALEEGTSVSGGFEFAQVDVFKGRLIEPRHAKTPDDAERMRTILPLHA